MNIIRFYEKFNSRFFEISLYITTFALNWYIVTQSNNDIDFLTKILVSILCMLITIIPMGIVLMTFFVFIEIFINIYETINTIIKNKNKS